MFSNVSDFDGSVLELQFLLVQENWEIEIVHIIYRKNESTHTDYKGSKHGTILISSSALK